MFPLQSVAHSLSMLKIERRLNTKMKQKDLTEEPVVVEAIEDGIAVEDEGEEWHMMKDPGEKVLALTMTWSECVKENEILTMEF